MTQMYALPPLMSLSFEEKIGTSLPSLPFKEPVDAVQQRLEEAAQSRSESDARLQRLWQNRGCVFFVSLCALIFVGLFVGYLVSVMVAWSNSPDNPDNQNGGGGYQPAG